MFSAWCLMDSKCYLLVMPVQGRHTEHIHVACLVQTAMNTELNKLPSLSLGTYLSI